MVEFKELKVKITENGDDYTGVAIKISDGSVWVKFDDSGEVVECPTEMVEVIYEEWEVA